SRSSRVACSGLLKTVLDRRRAVTKRSGPIAIGGFEEGEFEGDSPTEEVAAQIRVRGADAVQLRAQEIDEAAKIRIVVQRDPLGLHEVFRPWLRPVFAGSVMGMMRISGGNPGSA